MLGKPRLPPGRPTDKLPAEKPRSIRRKPRAMRGGTSDSDTSFESLREQGIRFAQALSGDIWTDYNLHDPGVTVLEQLCYALTDLVYRADFPVEDHLQAPDAPAIDYRALSLHPPDEAFPSRATSAADYRRVLIDQVPGLDDAQLATADELAQEPPRPADPESDADEPAEAADLAAAGGVSLGHEQGLYQLRLKLSQGLVMGDDTRVAEARAAYRARRNLCEDIASTVQVIGDAQCDLRIDVELAGPRDAVEVLAEIYGRCALHVAQGPRFVSMDELLTRGQTLEQIFTGPVMQQGFPSDSDGTRRELMFVSDLATLTKRVEGVHELRMLAVQREGQPPTTSAMRWRGSDWALRLRLPGVTPGLRTPEAVQELLDRSVRLRRAGSVVAVSPVALANRMADLYAGASARRHGHARSGTLDLPRGTYRDLQHYSSVQEGFPAVYGLGRRGMPASESPQRRAQALQLQTYLQLFEQVMANTSAQIEHLRDLYSVRDPRGPSYWWQLLGDETLRGADALYLPPNEATPRTWTTEAIRQRVLADVFESRDPRADRRSRALDHLLALHGQSFSQNTLRQFYNHLAPHELDVALLDNKAALLDEIVHFTRDRAAGLDYAVESWGVPGSGCGLQRRVSRLLGFRHAHSRALCGPLRQQQRSLVAPKDDASLGPVDDPGDTSKAPRFTGALTQADLRDDLARVAPLRRARMSEAFLRCAAYRERYRLAGPRQDDADAPALHGAQRLLLGPDENGRWWPLGEFDDPTRASRAVDSVRRFVLHLQQESEGLHVVEHVLLRPVGASPAHEALAGLPSDFYSLRLTAVFPAWGVRTAQRNFRRFAEETVRQNCPAHVAARCLWLDFEALRRFEDRWAEWLAAKVEFCRATAHAVDETSADPAAASRLNQAAAAVIDCLREAWATQPPNATHDDAEGPLDG